MKAKELLKITKGKLVSGSPGTDIEPSKISTDSRTIKKDEFFVALKGANFDGGAFLEDAFRKGARGALVADCAPGAFKRKRVVIQVEDTTKAFQDIAAYHRSAFEIPVIAVTGSNGKTAVKEMASKILSSRYKVLKNEGTKNNHIGVPATLLKLKPGHQICVLELGTTHRGEIRSLAAIARPSIAVITNIGPSHLEFLGSTKGVFCAKKEILGGVREDGIAIVNGDDRFLSKIKSSKIDITRFGLKKSNNFYATDIAVEKGRIKFSLNGRTRFELGLLGAHNIYNALAAIAIAAEFDISLDRMRKSLLDYKPSYMRLDVKRALNGVDILDDSYNSNPLSVECALDALRRYPAKSRWVVFGDMLELGGKEGDYHRMAGQRIAKSDVEGLMTFGKLSELTLREALICGMKQNRLWHCSTHDEIAQLLKKTAKKGDAVLIKGSRGMRMEEVVRKLRAQAAASKQQG